MSTADGVGGHPYPHTPTLPHPHTPIIAAHADWSCAPGKRWVAKARLEADGRWHAGAPDRVGELGGFLPGLRAEAGPEARVLVCFDFPLGFPMAYAERLGIDDFAALLPRLGEGEWSEFYEVAARPEEIGWRRPFYPARPGGTRYTHLLSRLDVETMDDLRRLCERARPGRRAAAPLFWTLGVQQVGKAAISGWRDVLAPAMREAETRLRLWPFEGALDDLLQPGHMVAAEAYPGEYYTHLGIHFPGGGKRCQAARAANAPTLLGWAAGAGITLAPELACAIEDGFGPRPDGEDPFDAVVGLFGVLNVLLGRRPPGEPDDERVRRIEGWILGQ